MRHIALIVAMMALSACGSRYVQSPVVDPEAEIRRTDDAEAIVELVQTYAMALDAFDLPAIRALVSDEYYENAGTTDTTEDDYGIEGVEVLLTSLHEHVESLNVDVAVRDLTVQGDLADVLCEYTFRMRYKVAEQERWETQRDVNRIQLRREDGEWRIIGGL
jgi:ketosteroid isomerase-like protein